MRTVTIGFQIEKIWYMKPVFCIASLLESIGFDVLAQTIGRKCFRVYSLINTLSEKDGKVISVERKRIDWVEGTGIV